MVVRGAPLVETMAGNATGLARSSRLTEIMFGETLKAPGEARTTHPSPPASAPNHALLLNAAEKRLIVEWMDLGGQYYNNPFDAGIRAITTLSQASFQAQVMPILQSTLRQLPSGHRQRGRHHHAGTAQPLRAHRQRRRGLQRDAVDDLRHLQGVEQPSAEPTVERAAPCRRQWPACSAAAAGQRQLQHHRRVDHHGVFDTMTSLQQGSLRRWAAVALLAIAGCGGGENPFDNPATVSNPKQVSGQKLSFAYFQKCINPIFLAKVRKQRGGVDQHLRQFGVP